MAEHLANIDITAAGTVKFAVPKEGVIYGVYSNAAVTIGYDDNGSVGTLLSNVTVWEPCPAFMPSPISYLVITAAAPCKVSIRYGV